MKDLFCIILAGGVGSRFYPLSNNEEPKQFLDFFNEKESLIQKTYLRISKFIKDENIYILTNKNYLKLTIKHLKKIPKKNILCEPQKKNTAASIAYGSFTIHKKNKHAKILVCPSDHLIEEDKKFQNTCITGFDYLNKNKQILTIGIKPTKAHTGYGYIKTKKSISKKITIVEDFKEKPDEKKAVKFFESKNYLWNSGMFIFTSNQIINEFKIHQKKTHDLFNKILTDENFDINTCFSNLKNISFDYAILEKSKNISVIRSNIKWNDLGSYSSLYSEMKKNKLKNAVNSKDVKTINSKNNLIILPSGKKLIVNGLNNYIIAEKNNTLLIYPMEKDQEIGNL